MSLKHSAPSMASGSEPKHQRKMLIAAEVRLLDKRKEGRRYVNVGRHYGINESTVCYIEG